MRGADGARRLGKQPLIEAGIPREGVFGQGERPDQAGEQGAGAGEPQGSRRGRTVEGRARRPGEQHGDTGQQEGDRRVGFHGYPARQDAFQGRTIQRPADEDGGADQHRRRAREGAQKCDRWAAAGAGCARARRRGHRAVFLNGGGRGHGVRGGVGCGWRALAGAATARVGGRREHPPPSGKGHAQHCADFAKIVRARVGADAARRGAGRGSGEVQARSGRSGFMTLLQAATQSWTNLGGGALRAETSATARNGAFDPNTRSTRVPAPFTPPVARSRSSNRRRRIARNRRPRATNSHSLAR